MFQPTRGVDCGAQTEHVLSVARIDAFSQTEAGEHVSTTNGSGQQDKADDDAKPFDDKAEKAEDADLPCTPVPPAAVAAQQEPTVDRPIKPPRRRGKPGGQRHKADASDAAGSH